MDRVSACGAEDTSSIPVGRTFKQKPVLKKSGYFLSFLDDKPLKIYHFSKTSKIAQIWQKMAESNSDISWKHIFFLLKFLLPFYILFGRIKPRFWQGPHIDYLDNSSLAFWTFSNRSLSIVFGKKVNIGTV